MDDKGLKAVLKIFSTSSCLRVFVAVNFSGFWNFSHLKSKESFSIFL